VFWLSKLSCEITALTFSADIFNTAGIGFHPTAQGWFEPDLWRRLGFLVGPGSKTRQPNDYRIGFSRKQMEMSGLSARESKSHLRKNDLAVPMSGLSA